MTLKERIKETEEGIYVLRNGDSDSRLYIAPVKLEEESYHESLLAESQYYSANMERKNYMIPLSYGESIMLRETHRNGEREECYYTHLMPCRPKKCLRVRWKRAFLYGKGAYFITFQLEDAVRETIAARRFWVEYRGKKYGFPGNCRVEPDTDSHRNKDWYVVELPDGVDVRELRVAADQLVLSKYNLIG